MNKDLEELKTVLRSIVVSSATPVDVRTLAYEYRMLLGSRLPIDKFGYRSVVDFLRDRCSDCFVFQGNPANPVLILIVPDQLQHIDNFVQRQKVSSAVKHKGKRRSILAPPSAPSRQPENNYNQVRQKLCSYKPKVTPPPTTKPFFPSSTNIREDYTNHRPTPFRKASCSPTTNFREEKYRSDRSTPSLSPSPNIREEEYTNDRSTPVTKPSLTSSTNVRNEKLYPKDSSKTNGHGDYKDNANIRNNNTQLANQNNVDEKTHGEDCVKDYDSGRLSSSSGSATNRLIERLKEEVAHLLDLNPQGIKCSDLMDLYKVEYHVELPLSRSRHTSVVSLCEALETVAIHRPDPTGDWYLYSPSAPPPQDRPAPPPRPAPSFVYKQKAVYDPEDALPGVAYHPSVYPEDCLGFEESIPIVNISDLCKVQFVDVIIGEVYTPSHFWLIRLGKGYHIDMENIMDKMDEYYMHGEGRHRKLAAGAVREGQYCAALFDGSWHRAVIVNIVDGDYVKVRHIDYGTVCRVQWSSLKPLRREWAALPAQAVRARLVDLVPPQGLRRWPLSASTNFLELVKDTRLVAEVVNVLPDELHVWLVNTWGPNDLCINQELIDHGYAEFSKQTSEVYSLPRWSALESGATPQYGDLLSYLRAGVEPRHLPLYTLHNPPDGTRTPPPTPHGHADTHTHTDTRQTRITSWKSLGNLCHTKATSQESSGVFPLTTSLQEDLATLRKEEQLQNASANESTNDTKSFDYTHDQFQDNTLGPELDSQDVEQENHSELENCSDDDLIKFEDTEPVNTSSNNYNSFSKYIRVPFASIPCFTPCLMNEIQSNEKSNARPVIKPNLSKSEYVLSRQSEQHNDFTETSSLTKLEIEDKQHLKFTPKLQSRSTSPITISNGSISNNCDVEVKKCPEISSTDNHTQSELSSTVNHTQLSSRQNIQSESHKDPCIISQVINKTQKNNNPINSTPPEFSPMNIPPPGMPYYPPNSLHPIMSFGRSSAYQQINQYQYNAQQTNIFLSPSVSFSNTPLSPPNMAPPAAAYQQECVTLSLQVVRQYLQMWPVSPETAARGLVEALSRRPLPGPSVSLTRLAVRVYFGLLPTDPLAAHEHIKLSLCSGYSPPPGF